MQTDIFRDLLTEPRLFVFLTAPWHAERVSCLTDFVADGPRYVMVDGTPRYEGTCREAPCNSGTPTVPAASPIVAQFRRGKSRAASCYTTASSAAALGHLGVAHKRGSGAKTGAVACRQ